MSMKVLYMGVWRPNDGGEPVELAHQRELSSFNRFTRGSIQEFLNLFVATAAKKTPAGKRVAIEEDKIPDYLIHTYNNSRGLCGVVVANKEYPDFVITGVLKKLCDEFSTKHAASAINNASANSLPYPELKDYIAQYQNPQEADKILKIQHELDTTKQVLHQTMESMLERGEKMDQLVAKSNDLSASSKMFYTQAKKQNSCCVVM
ncbi:palmitoyltransferase [Paraconiothyrium brasiliense]|uniref:Palmitoyltransferase n=1 Tax=Paraconiothyrium brasiliense TaxID=300254 RepID=A0ABR3S1T8_9PLEO